MLPATTRLTTLSLSILFNNGFIVSSTIASFNSFNPFFFVEYTILCITSAPYFICAFPDEALSKISFVYKSTKHTTTDVVPISIASVLDCLMIFRMAVAGVL